MRKIILFVSIVLIPQLLLAQSTTEIVSNLNMLWILISAAMIFLMQAGFMCLEVGLMDKKNISTVAFKNIIDYSVGFFAYFVIGFGFMFGSSWNGIIGTSLFLPESSALQPYGMGYFLFQVAFAATSITIVSGALAGRIGFIPYLTLSFLNAAFIYPVFGHWAWGAALTADNASWLQKLGFIDFAGASTVHSVGAWIALVSAVVLGPRIGRYTASGKLQPFKGYSFPFAVLGVFILWFGWWGFNGGSALMFNQSVSDIIFKTIISGVVSGLSGYFHCRIFQNREDIREKYIGSILIGLVAITACCHLVSTGSAVAIGLMAGIIHNYSYDLIIKKLKIDDAVGAIPVHGAGGVFGTLCVAIFGQADLLPNTRSTQFFVQLLGVVSCFIWAGGMSLIIMFILKKTVGLRISPEEEKAGITIGEPYEEELVQQSLDIEEMKKLMSLK